MITRDDWLTAVKDAGFADDGGDPDAITINEFAAMLSITQRAATYRLNVMVSRGLATKTYRVDTIADRGRRMRLLAYRLEKPRKKRR